jgi:hypothetical protein
VPAQLLLQQPQHPLNLGRGAHHLRLRHCCQILPPRTSTCCCSASWLIIVCRLLVKTTPADAPHSCEVGLARCLVSIHLQQRVLQFVSQMVSEID